jgi:hypothetical protein
VTARSESLLWFQLLGLAALPGEALLLLLVLAGNDPGPWPGVERLLCWALGGLAPAVLFWRSPPDIWSLLLGTIPQRGRSSSQRRLSTLQSPLPVKLLGALGGLLLLPALWRIDASAGLAAEGSPFGGVSRLLSLLLAAALLALMLWQWQQLVQAIWLLTRPDRSLPAPEGIQEATERERLSLGLPLLLPEPLRFQSRSADTTQGKVRTGTEEPVPETSAALVESPVAPEQEAEQEQSTDLDQQIS